MRVDPIGDVQPAHLASIAARANHDFSGNDTLVEDALLVVNVVEEQINGVDALLQSALYDLPFIRPDQPWHQVKRHNLIDAFGTLVHRERYAARYERPFRRLLTTAHFLSAEVRQATRQRDVVGPYDATLLEHFVPESGRVVRGEDRFAHRLDSWPGHQAAACSATRFVRQVGTMRACLLAVSLLVAEPKKVPDVGATSE